MVLAAGYDPGRLRGGQLEGRLHGRRLRRDPGRLASGLKRVVIIDVMTLATLFILRVMAGAEAVDAHASGG